MYRGWHHVAGAVGFSIAVRLRGYHPRHCHQSGDLCPAGGLRVGLQLSSKEKHKENGVCGRLKRSIYKRRFIIHIIMTLFILIRKGENETKKTAWW